MRLRSGFSYRGPQSRSFFLYSDNLSNRTSPWEEDGEYPATGSSFPTAAISNDANIPLKPKFFSEKPSSKKPLWMVFRAWPGALLMAVTVVWLVTWMVGGVLCNDKGCHVCVSNCTVRDQEFLRYWETYPLSAFYFENYRDTWTGFLFQPFLEPPPEVYCVSAFLGLWNSSFCESYTEKDSSLSFWLEEDPSEDVEPVINDNYNVCALPALQVAARTSSSDSDMTEDKRPSAKSLPQRLRQHSILQQRVQVHHLPHLLLFLLFLFSLTSCSCGVAAQRSRAGESPPPLLGTIPITSFSCQGRPAGYYADPATHCQVYHMCDTLQKQYSYLCPNYTLFNQKFMVCDHWYMVNCSSSSTFYDLNNHIGNVPSSSSSSSKAGANIIQDSEDSEVMKERTSLKDAKEVKSTLGANTKFQQTTKTPITTGPSQQQQTVIPTTRITKTAKNSNINTTPLHFGTTSSVTTSSTTTESPTGSNFTPAAIFQKVSVTQPPKTTSETDPSTQRLLKTILEPPLRTNNNPGPTQQQTFPPTIPQAQKSSQRSAGDKRSSEEFVGDIPTVLEPPLRENKSPDSLQPVINNPSVFGFSEDKRPITDFRPSLSSVPDLSLSLQPPQVGDPIRVQAEQSHTDITSHSQNPIQIPAVIKKNPVTSEHNTTNHFRTSGNAVNVHPSPGFQSDDTASKFSIPLQTPDPRASFPMLPGSVARDPGDRFAFTGSRAKPSFEPIRFQDLIIKPNVFPRKTNRTLLTSPPDLITERPHLHAATPLDQVTQHSTPAVFASPPKPVSSRKSHSTSNINFGGLRFPSAFLQPPPISPISVNLAPFVPPVTHPNISFNHMKQEFPTPLTTSIHSRNNLNNHPFHLSEETLPGAVHIHFPSTRGNRDFFIPSSGLSLPVQEIRPVNQNILDDSDGTHPHNDHSNEIHMTMVFPVSPNLKIAQLQLNPDCPKCHPAFLRPGRCIPCVIIR